MTTPFETIKEDEEEEKTERDPDYPHKIGKYKILRPGKEPEIVDEDPIVLMKGIVFYNKGDYIGMFTGDYLLLSEGFAKGHQVFYDAEEAVDHPKVVKEIKK